MVDAGIAGSISTLSRMERGKQPLRDVDVIRSLAEALGVHPNVLGLADTRKRSGLTRVPDAMVGPGQASAEGIDPMRRRTLITGVAGMAGVATMGTPAVPGPTKSDPVATLVRFLLHPPETMGKPVGLDHLRQQIAAAYSLLQHGRYADLAAYLPHLMSDGLATRAHQPTCQTLAEANGRLATIHTLASELMIKLGHDHLAWTTADRAVQTAQLSDDVLSRASARRAWAIVLRRAGHADTAQRLVIDTAAALQPELHTSAEHLSVYGALLTTAAYTAAVDGNRGDARTLIMEAADAATRLGADANHRHTFFGPTNVAIYQIGIARVLGDSGTAIEVARHINPNAIPAPERRARYWTDVARSFHQWNKPEQCYRALLAAEHATPDEVRYRKPVQHLTTYLLHHPRARNLPGLRGFAVRTGTAV